ncbi:MAG TPA: Fe-Mn family superoxide dismutase [Buchnera sp. (in: enterobacteria)]|nr:Fe-Mn family superoxide dismutase [Buchnera sp. (in: enterobacteria)]
MTYELPQLPYEYHGLEPYFDTTTMTIHHTKHHQNYVNNANIALQYTKFSNYSIDNLITSLHEVPSDKYMILRNNCGGHANHSFFWKILKIGTTMDTVLKKNIENNFDSIENFKKIFEKIAVNHFGSGWVWLVKKNDILSIVTTMNQDNPLMGIQIAGVSGKPILGLDLWEHAYYLKYQNQRINYIKSFWHVVNWDMVLENFIS